MRRKLWAGHPEAMQRKGQEADAASERSLGVVGGLIEREETGEGQNSTLLGIMQIKTIRFRLMKASTVSLTYKKLFVLPNSLIALCKFRNFLEYKIFRVLSSNDHVTAFS